MKQQELVTERLEQIFSNSKNLTIKLEKKQPKKEGAKNEDRKSGASGGSEATAESDSKSLDSPKSPQALSPNTIKKLMTEVSNSDMPRVEDAK